MAARTNSAWWWWGLPISIIVTVILLISIVLAGVMLNGQTNANALLQVAAACPVYEDGIHCFTGNACLVGLVTPQCAEAQWPPGGEGQGEEHWWPTEGCDRLGCSFKPLPDGSCCNAHDFCYAADPSKVCLSGRCVSQNFTLCRGFCMSNPMCSGSYQPPFLPAVGAVSATCINGACVWVARNTTPFVSCTDLLNQTTYTQRQITACLESRRFSYLVGGVYLETCTYSYVCSQGLEFSQPLGKKRAVTRELEELPRFPIPGRYTNEQYLVLNAELYASLK